MKVTFITEKNNNSELGKNLSFTLKNSLNHKNLESTIYELNDDDLHHCIGCFGCWVKTPGICTINDMGRTITQSIINSDLVIWLTPIVYGGYSAVLKKAIDRQLPLVLPFFTKINGELHHSKRYKKYPDILSIGYGEDLLAGEVNSFKDLAEANKRNFYTKNSYSYICQTPHECDTVLAHIDTILKSYEGSTL